MNKLKVLLLFAIALLAVALLQADEPELVITALDTLTLPMGNTFSVDCPNGDILFFDMQIQASQLHFTTFWYLEDSHQLTAPIEIGNASDPGISWQYMQIRVFEDKTCMLFSYPSNNDPYDQPVEGLLALTLHQDTVTVKIIDEFAFGFPFSVNSSCAIVAEDALVLALADSLVYYNTITGESETLMEGDGYQCNCMHDKQVRVLPDGNFLFIRDIHTGAIDAPEVWALFDSAGNHLFTQEITDPVICSVLIGSYFAPHPQNSPQWFYMPTDGDVGPAGWLECSYSDTGSFHIHYTASPSLDVIPFDILSFGGDKIMVRSFNNSADHVVLYCYNTPIELNPSPLFSYELSDFDWPYYPNSTAAEGFYFVPRLQDDIMHILAFWTQDVPIIHEFSFPFQHGPDFLLRPSYHGNKLRIISEEAISFYQVDNTPISNAEDTAVSPVNTLEIYPNPVGRKAGFTIQSDLKKPVELGIYNIRGQKVQTIKLDKFGEYSSNAADLQSLNSGIYLLKPLGTEKLPTRKFVVVK
ncbi:MAG: T9SS type A sorting domain-containing protein [Candidatus Cloacimonetes bacterium]|nr:T9SS type A sorting domain-containing protein [Candidatus Cloacimonadota bacterium]MDY0172069.1 T9SS type A sorting domain-containing protein [Candidatus Cloacimonadaceae bacterium]